MYAHLRRWTCLALTLGLAQAAAAQLVSPVGDIDPAAPGPQLLATFEGNLREVNLFGRDPALPAQFHTGESRFEQVDGDLTGTAYRGNVLTSISWRRDGFLYLPDDLQATNRTVRVHLRVGLGTFADFWPAFGANFETSSAIPGPTSVIGSSLVYQAFNLPDLRMAPPTRPAPFFVPFPFSTPFSVPQNGNANYDSLVWSLQVDGVLSGCYPLDGHAAVGAQATSASIGTGCIVGGRPVPMTLNLTGSMDPTVPEYGLHFDLDNAPALQPTTLIVGLAPQNVPIAGFCSNSYVQPFAAVALPPTNGMGFLATSIFTRWLDVYEAQHLYFQALVPDPGQLYPVKVAVSNGVDHRIVASGPKVKSLYSHLKDAALGDNGVEFGRGLVIQLETAGS